MKLLSLLISLTLPVLATDDIVVANFEGQNYGDWLIAGTAFGKAPATGKHGTQHAVTGFQGKGLVNSFTHGDKPTGHLLSPLFKVELDHLNFLIGGGHQPGKLELQLLVNDQVVRRATSLINDEKLHPGTWNVADLKGKEAQLRIIDKATGEWGHLNVDHIVQSTEPTPSPKIEQPKKAAPPVAKKADTPPAKPAPKAMPKEAPKVAQTPQPKPQPKADPKPKPQPKTTPKPAAKPAPATFAYNHPHRPQFHFTSQKGWINDPNGMVHDGQHYHLYFQHNPHGTNWGNMTWGHATSTDMVRWTQHPHAITPYTVDDRKGTIFSGTAVIDHNNSLGVQLGDTKTLVAFYTFANKPKFYQAMAYSTDNGKTFTLWNEGRAIVDNQGFDSGERDPKVFWHAPSQKWVMLLWVQQKSNQHPTGTARFFTSDDLAHWTHASDLKRDWVFECMDLVHLPLDGDKSKTHTLIYDASFDYEVGSFDGKEFKNTTPTLKQQEGHYYAAQTFNNSPDDRTVIIGWMRGNTELAHQLKLPWNQQMSFPSEMTLRSTKDGPRLFLWPVKEIDQLVTKSHELKNGDLSALPKLDLQDLTIQFSPSKEQFTIFELQHCRLRYDLEKGLLQCLQPGNKWATLCRHLAPRDGKISLRLLIDRMSVEAFAHQGEITGALVLDPRLAPNTQNIVGAQIHHLTIRELKSSWK
ncbi:MAG: hypothetical protein ACSHYF_17695 [Verrucomicrobiaceae bacterium]